MFMDYPCLLYTTKGYMVLLGLLLSITRENKQYWSLTKGLHGLDDFFVECSLKTVSMEHL